jgi:GTPase KRas protein
VSIDGEDAELDIADTVGQGADFDTLQDHWIRQGEGFLLVYSITSRSTFEEIALLQEKILKFKESSRFPTVLVGNKCDLESDRVVSVAEGKAFADKHSMHFFETSAKDKINHEECFFAVVRDFRSRSTCGGGGRPITKQKSLCTIL